MGRVAHSRESPVAKQHSEGLPDFWAGRRAERLGRFLERASAAPPTHGVQPQTPQAAPQWGPSESGLSLTPPSLALAGARRRLDIGTLIIRPQAAWPAVALKGSRRKKKTRFRPGLKNASESALSLGLGTSRHSPPVLGTTPTVSGVSGPPVFDHAIQRLSDEMLKLEAQTTIRRTRASSARRTNRHSARTASSLSRARSTSVSSLKKWTDSRVDPKRGETTMPRALSSAATASPSRPGKRAEKIPERSSAARGVRTVASRRSRPVIKRSVSARLCSRIRSTPCSRT